MKAERQKALLEYILLRKVARIEDLAEQFRVSPMTIRRDLAVLETGGLVRRVSGGVEAVDGAQREPPYKLRMFSNPQEKERIARLAEKLVDDGDLIFLDVGTTCLHLAKLLSHRNVTVVTNWLPAMVELARSHECTIVNTGGQVNKEELSSVGVLTYETVGAFSFRRAFIGVGGVTAEGMSDFRLESVEIKRRVMQLAREVIVLADHSKFGKVAPVKVGAWSGVHKLVLADAARVDSRLLKRISDQGVELIY